MFNKLRSAKIERSIKLKFCIMISVTQKQSRASCISPLKTDVNPSCNLLQSPSTRHRLLLITMIKTFNLYESKFMNNLT